MLKRLRQAGLVWPTVAALAGLAVLIGLGTWQLERKRWKEDLIAKISAGAKAEPILLSPVRKEVEMRSDGVAVVAIKDPFIHEYRHVAAIGRFRHDKEQYLYAPAVGRPGWHVYTPMVLPSQAMVWVNRGFVPHDKKAPETRPQGQIPGEVEVRGLARLPVGRGLFTPENNIHKNLWYWPDIAAMTVAAFPDGLQKAAGGPRRPTALPLVIEADAKPEPPGGLPRGGVTRLDLPNRHLEYAITWYGLALALAGVYFAFAINRLRAS